MFAAAFMASQVIRMHRCVVATRTTKHVASVGTVAAIDAVAVAAVVADGTVANAAVGTVANAAVAAAAVSREFFRVRLTASCFS